MNNCYEYKTRVYYEDTDAAGVVYHSNYLRFMERARTEWQFSLGFDTKAMREYHAYFPVVSVQLEFKAPARLHDQLLIVTKIKELKRVTVEFEQWVKSLDQPELLFCHGFVKVACVNEQMKPHAIPEVLRRSIEHVCER